MTSTYLVKSFSGVVVLLALVAYNGRSEAFDKMKCNGMDITLSEAQLNNIKECAAKMGVKSAKEMTKEKMPCFAKCVMEKKGLVDETGKPHKENIHNMIDSAMPEKVRGDLKAKMEKCMEEHGNIDPSDASCLTYAPLAMCGHQAVVDVCTE